MSTFSFETLQQYRTLIEALNAAPVAKPFVTVWHDENDYQTVTFGEFNALARGQARLLEGRDIGPSDRIVLVMPQGIALMSAFTGALLRGAVPAILAYPNFKADPAKYRSGLAGVTRNLKAKLVIVDDAFPEELVEHLTPGNDEAVVWRTSSDFAIAEAPSHARARYMPDSSAIAFIQHSAGTTGLQKGVALSHHAVLVQLEHLCKRLAISTGDRIYSWLPLYHDMGLIASFMLPMACHLSVVMQSPDEWVMRPTTMLSLISQYRSTLAWMPNFALQFVARRVRRDDLAHCDLSSLRAVINCSEPVTARSMDAFGSAFVQHGLRSNVLQASYAMAENVFAVTQSDLSPEGPKTIWVQREGLRQIGRVIAASADDPGAQCLVSSGRCLERNEVKIVSPDQGSVEDGNVGEIWIRSDSLFAGYYNRQDLTDEAFSDGWYKTGDLGFLLDGELFVVGRKKDVIIVAGQNIVPQDVEEIVTRHPAIHDGRAVAIGIF
ncbi:MAG: AMP-binding protein, partial [Candidatus Acidiferrales bacterium]